MKITTHRHGLLSKLRLRLSGETGGDARVRTAVDVPLAFADGYETSARVFTFRGLGDGQEHLVLALGDWETAETPLVRIHSECLTGDVFGSARCDCGPQLREAVERIAEHGGFVIYMRQEGRGIGLYNKLDAYALQDAGLDTYEANIALGQPADGRDYTAAAHMLKALGREQIDLLSNNPDKASQLEANGIAIRGRRTTGVFARPTNERYLLTKVLTTGHDMSLAAIHPAHA